MKILTLRFKNLNSLYGEYLIDFRCPDYTSEGIFLLTGPTGSGKTTVLDAICLALYGRTPRLDSSGTTNEIMSRGTGECYAEALIEAGAKQYLCNWSQNKARKKSSGKLQNAKHEISNADDKTVIASKITDTAKAVVSATGMDFAQFTRSMLLAQGDFDTFLNAAPNNKSEILEKITGTRIYSEISKRVYERNKKESEELAELQHAQSAAVCLDDEAEKKLRQTIAKDEESVKQLQLQCDEIKKGIDWLARLDTLQSTLKTIDLEEAELQSSEKEFQPERKRLERAEAAARFNVPFADLERTRSQHTQDSNALTAAKKELLDLQNRMQQAQKDLEEAKRLYAQAQEEKERLEPLINEVVLLDHSLTQKSKEVKRVQSDHATLQQELSNLEDQYKNDQNCEKTTNDELNKTNEYLEKNAHDSWLVSEFSGLRTNLDILTDKQSDVKKQTNALKKHDKTLQNTTALYGQQNQKLKEDTKKHEEEVQQLDEKIKSRDKLLEGRLIRDYQQDKEKLIREQSLLNTIANLEEHRQKLEDGKPCPLCGSLSHPYVSDHIPEEPDDMEQKIKDINIRLEQVESVNTLIEQITVRCQDLLLKKNESQMKANQLKEKIDDETLQLKTAENELTDMQNKYNSLKLAIDGNLKKLEVDTDSELNIFELIAALETRRDAWNTHTQNKDKLTSQLKEVALELKNRTDLINAKKAEIQKKQEETAVLKKDYDALNKERQEKFGDKNPEEESSRLKRAISESSARYEKAQTDFNDTSNGHRDALTRSQMLQGKIDERAPLLAEQEKSFLNDIQSAGFADEHSFRVARLEPNQCDALKEQSRKLEDRRVSLTARRKDYKQKLDDENAKHITNKSSEILTEEDAIKNAEIKKLESGLRDKEYVLKQNEVIKEQRKERQILLDAKISSSGQWKKLNDLIGQAEGAKFRRFAQDLTFKEVIRQANQQLVKMFNRYKLELQKELVLDIQDEYLNEIRPTINLSGGERFLVSLALALGLSSLTSRNSENVRMDSLFLDEGFGTLDEDTLDTTIEALVEVQKGGKLIGVISHRPELQERIRTRIEVVPQSGGRSHLKGPGVTRIS